MICIQLVLIQSVKRSDMQQSRWRKGLLPACKSRIGSCFDCGSCLSVRFVGTYGLIFKIPVN